MLVRHLGNALGWLGLDIGTSWAGELFSADVEGQQDAGESMQLAMA